MKFDKQDSNYKHLTTFAKQEEKKRVSITFLPTHTLQEKSMRLYEVSFADLDDETQKLYVKVLLKNQPAAQHNMLKKQFELNIINLTLIADAIGVKRQQKDSGNCATKEEDETLKIISELIFKIASKTSNQSKAL